MLSSLWTTGASCIRKPQVISGGGRGSHPLHPPLRSAPACWQGVSKAVRVLIYAYNYQYLSVWPVFCSHSWLSASDSDCRRTKKENPQVKSINSMLKIWECYSPKIVILNWKALSNPHLKEQLLSVWSSSAIWKYHEGRYKTTRRSRSPKLWDKRQKKIGKVKHSGSG